LLGGQERALALACAVAAWEQQEQMVAAAMVEFGRIDVVFANAGGGVTCCPATLWLDGGPSA
jgi:NAD(P)-dependent dehydrogenase (short-subunit alcohol dehydrogenase family)